SKKAGGDPAGSPPAPATKQGAERETDETDNRGGGGSSDRHRAPPRGSLPGELRGPAGDVGHSGGARDGDGAAPVRIRSRRPGDGADGGEAPDHAAGGSRSCERARASRARLPVAGA